MTFEFGSGCGEVGAPSSCVSNLVLEDSLFFICHSAAAALPKETNYLTTTSTTSSVSHNEDDSDDEEEQEEEEEEIVFEQDEEEIVFEEEGIETSFLWLPGTRQGDSAVTSVVMTVVMPSCYEAYSNHHNYIDHDQDLDPDLSSSRDENDEEPWCSAVAMTTSSEEDEEEDKDDEQDCYYCGNYYHPASRLDGHISYQKMKHRHHHHAKQTHTSLSMANVCQMWAQKDNLTTSTSATETNSSVATTSCVSSTSEAATGWIRQAWLQTQREQHWAARVITRALRRNYEQSLSHPYDDDNNDHAMYPATESSRISRAFSLHDKLMQKQRLQRRGGEDWQVDKQEQQQQQGDEIDQLVNAWREKQEEVEQAAMIVSRAMARYWAQRRLKRNPKQAQQQAATQILTWASLRQSLHECALSLQQQHYDAAPTIARAFFKQNHNRRIQPLQGWLSMRNERKNLQRQEEEMAAARTICRAFRQYNYYMKQSREKEHQRQYAAACQTIGRALMSWHTKNVGEKEILASRNSDHIDHVNDKKTSNNLEISKDVQPHNPQRVPWAKKLGHRVHSIERDIITMEQQRRAQRRNAAIVIQCAARRRFARRLLNDLRERQQAQKKQFAEKNKQRFRTTVRRRRQLILEQRRSKKQTHPLS